ncbi:hypothetical protein Moror_16539 [Moniliophthora roreri MCA 2997]|uniref:DUF6533 domain-containing protein n=1 Tax=Moniliophthora roreri (strain MCA 2997) TaxID=1381753 RepID=V2WVE8_MONRO|nr:hypothetical protein Moror_16539 [Moniliophthora roreri MCA 2997]
MQDSAAAGSEAYPTSKSFLPAGAGPPYLVGSYVAAGTLGMFLWDIMIHIGSEYELLLKQKITLTTIVYFWCRLNALLNVLSSALFYTAPLDHYCSSLFKLILGGFPPLITSISLLLFLRVRAVYTGNRPVVAVFFLCFLVVMGCSMLAPFTGTGHKVGPTNPYCTITQEDVRLGAGLLMIPLVNNIAIFVAITIKFMPASPETAASDGDTISKIRRLLQGKHLPGLSRTLWQDGQKYILASILITLIAVAALSISSIPNIYGFILVAPHAAVENSMNSYMIRSIRASALRPDRNVNTTFNLHTTPELETQGEGPVLPR